MTELIYRSATEMLADLNAKRVSAQELLVEHLARNDALHGKLNIVVDKDIARAERDARAIDEARAKGQSVGALAGIPMTVKDGYDAENMPAVCGNPDWANRSKTCRDADLVANVRGAGAVVWGKTNVPIMLGDWQSYNAVYGTTNNPYDVTRVPGGSSGGSAAALASGITPLEIGSDIGGSLRVPANFCGVYALKPTWGLLSVRGHIPPPPGIEAEVDLGVMGPMARTPADLRLLHGVLAGKAAAPARSIKGRKVALWLDEPAFVVGADARAAVLRAADALKAQGAEVIPAKPDIPIGDMMGAYRTLLMSALMLADLDAATVNAAGANRNRYKAQLAAFFDAGWNAILCPVTPMPAFVHTQEGTMADRVLKLDGADYAYGRILEWISMATSLHAPALAAPAGQTASGLPIGVQLIGRWNEEAALMDYADALDEAFGFMPPKL